MAFLKVASNAGSVIAGHEVPIVIASGAKQSQAEKPWLNKPVIARREVPIVIASGAKQSQAEKPWLNKPVIARREVPIVIAR
jgi:Rieske Fe-S protein